jgi:hypothetical protein
MSERLKPIRFKKGSLITICPKAKLVAIVIILYS